MQVHVVFTVMGVHDRRVTRPSGILRIPLRPRPYIAKENAGTVRVLAHAAGTNEWLAVHIIYLRSAVRNEDAGWDS